MVAFITKLFLHPLFRFFFWIVFTAWLVVMGIFNIGWFRWINLIMAIILLGPVIENAKRSIVYFREN